MTALPEMHDVKSSNLSKVGHQGDSLYIRFKPSRKEPDGALWRYSPVHGRHLEALLQAESPGRYFIEHIKDRPGIQAEKVG